MTNLRGHHLICLQFYHGEGYNSDFIENLEEVLKTAERTGVGIRGGVDDVCRRCPHMRDLKCLYREGADREIKEMDERALVLLDASEGTVVEWGAIGGKIAVIFPLWYESYCISCGWRRACEKDDGYRRLRDSLPQKRITRSESLCR